jgi:hypothetical protein
MEETLGINITEPKLVELRSYGIQAEDSKSVFTHLFSSVRLINKIIDQIFGGLHVEAA